MSIASRITSIENHIEEAYTEISRLGVDLTNVDKNIDNIADMLQEAYENTPKVSGEGSNLSLTPTRKGGLTIIPKGACEQDSYSGKNKFNKNALALGKNWSGSVGTTCYPFNNQSTRAVILLEVQPSTTYAISLYESEWYCMQIMDCDENYVITKESYLSNISNSFEVTMTTRSTAKYIGLKFKYGSDGTTEMTESLLSSLKMQVEQNNAVTSYEKYVGGIPSPNPDYPQDIRNVTGDNSVVVQNKNIWKSYNLSRTNASGIDWVTATDGTITANGLATSTSYSATVNLLTNEFYLLSAGTYCLSGASTKIILQVIDDNGNLIAITTSSTTNVSFILSQDTLVQVRARVDNGVNVTNETIKPMIEKGNVASSYIAPQIQTATLHLGTEYLAGIGDYKDEIVGKTDDWKIKRYIGKLFVKDLSWEKTSSQPIDTDLIMFYSSSNNDRLVGLNLHPLCNYLTYTGEAAGAAGGRDKGVGFWFYRNTEYPNNRNIYIIIPKTIASNSTELINWATTNNVEMDYQLAENIEIPIIDTTLINDLNALQDMLSYDGTTNITITSNPNNAQMIASVSALKGE